MEETPTLSHSYIFLFPDKTWLYRTSAIIMLYIVTRAHVTPIEARNPVKITEPY